MILPPWLLGSAEEEQQLPILLSYLLPFLFGIAFFSLWLFRDYETTLRSAFVPLVFAITFALSFHLHLLVIFEILNYLDSLTRQELWSLDLGAIAIMLIWIIPFLFFWAILDSETSRSSGWISYKSQRGGSGSSSNSNQRKGASSSSWCSCSSWCCCSCYYLIRLVLACVLQIIYLTGYIRIGHLFEFLRMGKATSPAISQEGYFGKEFLEHSLAGTGIDDPEGGFEVFWDVKRQIVQIGVFGVILMASLSGFGAVNTPYVYLPYFNEISINDQDVELSDQKLLHLIQTIATKKKNLILWKLARSSSLNFKNGREHIRSTSSWFTSKLRRFVFDTEESDLEAKEREILGLERLSEDLFLEVNEKKMARSRMQFMRHTLLGRIQGLLGYVFSAYCVIKMIVATVNVVFNRDPEHDTVTIGFRIFFRIFAGMENEIDAHFAAQVVSFGLVGVLVFTSVRGFLVAIGKAFHQISSTISSNAFVLLLTQIQGMYFVSSILLMRMNVPPEYREAISVALGKEIQFFFYHRWFDRIFLVSSLATLAGLYMHERTRQSRVDRTQFPRSVHHHQDSKFDKLV